MTAPALPFASSIAGIHDYRRVPIFNVAENSRILQRYEFIERRLTRVIAGWLPGTPRWEVKFILGRLAWEDSEHTQMLRSRILELRTSERILDRAPSLNLSLVLDELVLADDWLEFLAGLVSLKRALLGAYERHLGQTQPLVDQPTCRILRILGAEEREQIALLDEQIALGAKSEDRARLEAWTMRITGLIDAAAGIQGIDPVSYTVRSEELRAGQRTFVPDRTYMLDGRFSQRQVPRFLPGQESGGEEREDVYRQIAMGRFAEMQAAASLALSLYENDGQPWEYYHLTARHLWDEIRHCAMGQAMLEDLGLDWTKVPHFVGNYQFYASLPPLERIVRLGVIIELSGMESGLKRREVETARTHRLELAETFQDYDWADEVNHVDYAQRVLAILTDGDDSAVERAVIEVKARESAFRRPYEEEGGRF